MRVLLLEAGPARLASLHPHARGPGQAGRQEGASTGTTAPQPEPQLDNRALWWPRGKVLGGSSSINAMCYIRGVAARLRRLGGARRDRLGLGQRCCRTSSAAEGNARGGDALHGGDGPLSVSDLRYVNPLSRSVHRSRRSRRAIRATTISTARGRKASACTRSRRRTARAARPPSLTCDPGSANAPTSPCTPARWSAASPSTGGTRANGVTYRHARQGLPPRGRARSAAVRRRDQFAAAADAVGHRPPAELRRHGIDVRGATRRASAPTCRTTSTSARCSTARSAITYDRAQRRCRWPSTITCAAIAARAPATSPKAAASSARASRRTSAPTSSCISSRRCSTTTAATACRATATPMHACFLRPRSRGRIALASNRVGDKPRIEANYLSDPEGFDLKMMVECAKLSREIFAQPAFDPYRGAPIYPARNDLQTTASWSSSSAPRPKPSTTRSAPAAWAATTLPWSIRNCACAASRAARRRCVGDADAAGGNTNAPTIMIAERAADLIRA